MPCYEYECKKCGIFEEIQKIKDKPLKKCPKCGDSVKKLISSNNFHLKGGGWYKDGYSKQGK